MLIVFLIIAVVAILLGVYINKQNQYSCHGDILNALGWIFGSIVVIAMIVVCFSVSYASVIDRRIKLYQEENTKIEKEVSVIVEGYKEFESSTFKELKIETNLTVTISLYPELKSNELVNRQIDVYIKNNDKIKQLKEEKLNYSVAKWWLYFGK